MKADIAVFDPDTVRDKATFDAPHQYAEGFSYVIVNGQVAFENGAMPATGTSISATCPGANLTAFAKG